MKYTWRIFENYAMSLLIYVLAVVSKDNYNPSFSRKLVINNRGYEIKVTKSEFPNASFPFLNKLHKSQMKPNSEKYV